MKKFWILLGLAGFLCAPVLQAAMVDYVGLGPNRVVNVVSPFHGSVNVYAGVYNLTVDGTPTSTLCIDLARWAPPDGAHPYSTVALASAPLSPSGPMGEGGASLVARLWATYFTGALSDVDGSEAAALQAAVWMAVAANAASPYTLTINGNTGDLYQRAVYMYNNPGLGEAPLLAVVNETYQNYIVPVPEPTTIIAGALLLLPFGVSTLRILRKKYTA